MPNFEDNLRALEQEIQQLRESSRTDDRFEAGKATGYTEGWRACHQQITSQIREILNTVITHPATPATPGPVEARAKTLTTSPLSAPAKDQLVREFLAAHPGARYRDIKQALGQYPANRAYALRDRGEVHQDEEKRFYLNPTAGAHNERPH